MKPIDNTLKYGWVIKEQKREATAVAKWVSALKDALKL